MTLHEKKIKVAEKCGIRFAKRWQFTYANGQVRSGGYFEKEDAERELLKLKSRGCWGIFSDITSYEYFESPDYPNDLNAMHEAEKVLTIEHCVIYEKLLTNAANRNYRDDTLDIPSQHLCWGVKCEQRFDAFGITCGLWKEGE